MSLKNLKIELNRSADKKQAEILSRFFKTGQGEYGEGDIFLGVKVPEQRKLAQKYLYLSLAEVIKLLKSKIHEHRQTALFVLVYQYQKGSGPEKRLIFKAYLKNTAFINNWDLVDASAPNIVGDYLLNRPKKILYDLARSKSLWERRIAMVATMAFIRQHNFKDTLAIAEILLTDKQDLIHKAVGWMLREAGKRNQKVLTEFLEHNLKRMPRTALRYAIERFEEKKRQEYLKKKLKI